MPAPRARIGVVIPARNEAARIGACLASLAPFFAAGDRIVVVDDGSDDGTADRARAEGAEALSADRTGRGFAVAFGAARVAEGSDAVLVAHADMIFPERARAAIVRVLAERPEAPGGFLGHRIAAQAWRYRVLEAGNRFRAAAWGLAYGDQGVFVRTRVLAVLGGFPAQARLEDLELALRLRALGPLADGGCAVTIPARHWEAGLVRTTLRNWSVVLRYVLARRG
jgi:glycosyltransferase involved in cell wall biosynthesis